MPKTTERSFGAAIRERRRQLDLTQEEIARQIATSTPYIGHLESGKRHPSEKVIARLSEVLGLSSRELFFLANPEARTLVNGAPEERRRSAWEDFRRDSRLRRVHNISADEMELLARVAAMGEVRAPRDFIYVLNAVRQALGR
ncbi:MAG TPA: helix-turn-helix transcriptional regulator [Candidatus Binataceae bacterium]|jgi:transcriptional regulator with XRE-family HTH domain|nr:helix-turn-helix transcriptional regulator [Candidatus Binataceae bacterium]